jgi:hypothetical protein
MASQHKYDTHKYMLKKVYGITKEQFNNFAEKQDNKCGICYKNFTNKVPFNPNVDHDHTSNKIRGLLCGKCNRALGLLQDDPIIIKRAITYLRGEL